MRRWFLLLFLAASSVRAGELRGFWVESFRTPLATKIDVDRVIDAAEQANANALFVQVRRRADSWYIDSAEPLSGEPAVGAPDEIGRWTFDPLRYLIDAAHAHAIQIHAFVIVGSIHNGDPTEPGGLPSDPNHVFLQHVWDAAAGAPYRGARQWATRALPHNRSGVTFDGYRFGNEWYIDLGNPEAASYTAEILLHLVRAYDIDGLHLDRIRYPDAPIDRAGASNVGYNETNVARFKARYGERARYYEARDVGRTVDGRRISRGDVGYPRTSDPLWNAWRREQVTRFVRRLYLSATAIKPSLNVSAALICYGAAPSRSGGFEESEAYWHVFQDWAAWADEGILDTLAPMMYKREHLAVQRAQFDGWLSFLMRTAHATGRMAVPGIGAFMNSIEGSLRQARRARDAGANGVIFFAVGDTAPRSGGSTNAALASNPFADGDATPKRPSNDFFAALRSGTSADGGRRFEHGPVSPLFASPIAPPHKSAPASGALMGYAAAGDGAPVTVESVATHQRWTTSTDGSGFFGLLKLEPGEYRVTVGGITSPPFPVVAGSVSRVQ